MIKTENVKDIRGKEKRSIQTKVGKDTGPAVLIKYKVSFLNTRKIEMRERK